MTDSIFYQIANGHTDTKLVYEDDLVVAFPDRSPQAPVHLLIVPKKRLNSLAETDETDEPILGRMLTVARKLATQHHIADSGYKLIINTGSHAGQTVDHLHLHLLGGAPIQGLT